MSDNHNSGTTIRRSRAALTDVQLLEEILKNPGKSIKELSAKIGLCCCATREHVQVLATARLVEIGRGPSPYASSRECDIIFPMGYLNA